jgi:hypothetical protein
MAIRVKLTLNHLILGVGIVYLGLQIPEEGLFNFAAWIRRHGWIPNFTVTAWLLALPYCLLALSLAFFIYRIDPEKFLSVGLGIIVWGLLDFLGFAGLSLMNREYSPGLIASLVFLPLALLAGRILRRQGRLTPRLAGLASACGILIMVLPLAISLAVIQVFEI